RRRPMTCSAATYLSPCSTFPPPSSSSSSASSSASPSRRRRAWPRCPRSPPWSRAACKDTSRLAGSGWSRRRGPQPTSSPSSTTVHGGSEGYGGGRPHRYGRLRACAQHLRGVRGLHSLGEREMGQGGGRGRGERVGPDDWRCPAWCGARPPSTLGGPLNRAGP